MASKNMRRMGARFTKKAGGMRRTKSAGMKDNGSGRTTGPGEGVGPPMIKRDVDARGATRKR